MPKIRVLVIEDESHIAEGVKLNLDLNGYLTEIASNGSIGLEMWKTYRPDLIILDLMMPEVDGHEVLESIRKKDREIPILILTAKDAIDDKRKCFNSGGDDYLIKPFDLEELLLRVQSLLRRRNDKLTLEDAYIFGSDHKIDFVRSLGVNGLTGESFSLTAQEVELMRFFIENEQKVLSRQEILESAWGYDRGTSTRTVDNFIVRLRKYFESDPKNPVFFKSVRSIGYIFSSK